MSWIEVSIDSDDTRHLLGTKPLPEPMLTLCQMTYGQLESEMIT